MNLWCVVCGLACLTSTGQAFASGLDFSAASPTAAQIDDYLTKKKSPIAGTGAAFYQFGRDYDIDPRLVVAIAGAESTFGLHVCATNNAWNWFHRRTCPPSTFDSYQEGAERVTRGIRLSYVNRGYDTIELIRFKYCASGCDTWIPLVTSFYNAMPSNAASAPAPQPQPSQPQTLQPDPTGSTPPAAQPRQFLGLPLYLVFFIAALFVGVWAIGGLKR